MPVVEAVLDESVIPDVQQTGQANKTAVPVEKIVEEKVVDYNDFKFEF